MMVDDIFKVMCETENSEEFFMKSTLHTGYLFKNKQFPKFLAISLLKKALFELWHSEYYFSEKHLTEVQKTHVTKTLCDLLKNTSVFDCFLEDRNALLDILGNSHVDDLKRHEDQEDSIEGVIFKKFWEENELYDK